jgi:predicted nucleotidyltransferase component of viral defense system
MRDHAASIRGKLYKLSKSSSIGFNFLITRYFHERLLFRLSRSRFADNFCLKGGALLYALEGVSARQTKDLDLLGRHISNLPEHIKACIAEILTFECEEDGVLFDTTTVITSEIVKEGNYRGVRVEFIGYLGQIREKLQIDIGFGDVIIPAPLLMPYPSLIDLPGVEVLAYSVESVIAEKFHAMVYLGTLNSRMKDFYDLYRLLQPGKFDESVLYRAIVETFRTRETTLSVNAAVFSPAFSADENRKRLWRSFLLKSRLDDISLDEVVSHIRRVLLPLIE